MKTRTTSTWPLPGRVAILALACGAALPLQAQVVREEGVKSIAGVFVTTAGQPTRAEWSFKSAGGEILFATLDADIYRPFGEHEAAIAAAAAGCEDDGGGPGLFRLSVVDGLGQSLCTAGRPAPPPGWMRDPRLACVLPTLAAPATYRLRVELTLSADHHAQPAYPYLLNLSLRKIAKPGTGVAAAVATSTAGGF